MSENQNPQTPPQTPPQSPDAAEEETIPTADVDPLAALQDDVERLKSELLYAKAETENTRRRLEQAAEDRGRYAMANFAKDMLTVSDNLRRALDAVPPEARDGDTAANSLIVGVEMTERELMSILERHGIHLVPALGERFDPNLHQAMMEIEDPANPSGTVVYVMQPGYQIQDRLLRPAMVGVSKGGPKAPPGEKVDTNA